MVKEYKITPLKYFYMLLDIAISILLFTGLVYLFKAARYPYETVFSKDYINFCILLYSAFNLPIIYLYFEYCITNYRTQLSIDIERKSIEIKEGKKQFRYTFDDVTISKYHKKYFFQRQIGIPSFIGVFFKCGYWVLKFKDGNHFFISSLMLRPKQKTLLKNTLYEHRILPYIKKDEYFLKEK